MTIKYSNGKAFEAVLLSRTDDNMRLAVQGADDVMEFSNINGTWVSADCEPVTIEFAWQRRAHKPTVTEAECSCSHELAARLIHLLHTDSSEDRIEMEAPVELQHLHMTV
jgi:hypothetical protein